VVGRGTNTNPTSISNDHPMAEASPADVEPSATVARLTVEEYPPFTSKYMQGKGLLSTVVREAFALEGIGVELNFFPGSRAFRAAKHGSYDGTFNWADRKDRHAFFYYSDWLMEAEREMFFFKKGLDFHWDAKQQNYSSIAGWPVVAILGYDHGVSFQEAEKNNIIKVYRVSTVEQAFKMVLSEHAKLFFHFDVVGNHFVHEKISLEQKQKLDSVLATDGPKQYDYVLFSKRSKYGEVFLQAFNSGLRKLKASGRHAEILKTSFSQTE
jgi:polar amino acid transport system substrate-binding protein